MAWVDYAFVKMRISFFASFLIFAIYRTSSVFLIQTYYVADEYWQSLEIAHNMVFGYGYMTWEWKHGLRSYLYPLVFAVFYKILQFLHMDYVFLITTIPKLLQAVITALSDQYFLQLCENFKLNVYWTKIYILTNWFWYYCGSRTITNTIETCLTIIALYYYPWELFYHKTKNQILQSTQNKNKSFIYLTLSAVNCIIRPTAVTIWGPLLLFHFLILPFKDLKKFIIKFVCPIFASALILSIIIDFIWYGKLIIPAYNFFKFNIFQDVSSFYGTHPFYWYFNQGLPIVLGVQMLAFVFGVFLILRDIFTKENVLLKQVYVIWFMVFVINILLLSSIPHKEFRFALPLLPFMTLIALKTSEMTILRTYKTIWTAILIIWFIIPTILFGIIHQRGSLQLINHLSSITPDCAANCNFLFLTPCHSTPLYSHLHKNISTKFLTCHPPLEDTDYDESEDFFQNPQQWLNYYWSHEKVPSHVVFFDRVEDSIKSFLNDKGFSKTFEFFHTLFPEGHVGKYFVVYEPS